MMRCIVSAFLVAGSFSLHGNASIDRLIEGNKRFIQNDVVRREMIHSQHPFCAILACSDSRVAPEMIFDQGLGDLFVIRLAGNVAAPEALESLDFACNVLNVDLILVLGHQNCGAIQAVMQHTENKELGAIATLIEPAVRNASTVDEAIQANVKAQMRIIQNDKDLGARIQDGSLRLLGGVYNFETGVVSFF